MNTRVLLAAVFVGCLLLSRESLSQVIFPDGGSATQPYTNAIGANPFLLGSANNQFGFNNSYNFYNPYNTPYTTNVVNNNPYNPYIQTNVCICTPNGRCFSTDNPTTGSGIDIRIVNTPGGTSTGSIVAITTPASSGINPVVASQSFCQSNLQLCCPAGGYSCGVRYSPFPNAPVATGSQAQFGSFPWQGIILTSGNFYVGSGALIDHMHFLTVAHKVNAYLTNGAQLKVRLGEWNVGASSPLLPYQEFTVTRIFVHPQYSPTTLANSIAILRLSPTVPLGQIPTITTGCLPSSYVSNVRCWVAGWGASSFQSGSSTTIQTQVDVPIVDQSTCQSRLRSTRLGSNFNLDTFSFMCAGGEAGKDACTGDGGSPLVCPFAGRWFVVGLVAWGVGCGTTDVPGVYINVANYINWIQSTTRTP